MEACRVLGAELLVDAYHGLNAVPFSLKNERLEGAFVVGGGYKYCQLGEGNCFLRFPRGTGLRPIITGWFSEFSTLAAEPTDARVVYGRGPDRFAGSSYDPTSHYRAADVFDFFEEHSLTPEFLRGVSRHQVALLAKSFDDLDADPKIITRDRSLSLDAIGGFLSLISTQAESLCTRLQERGVLADYRGNLVRLGPAPYLTDSQIKGAIDALGEIV